MITRWNEEIFNSLKQPLFVDDDGVPSKGHLQTWTRDLRRRIAFSSATSFIIRNISMEEGIFQQLISPDKIPKTSFPFPRLTTPTLQTPLPAL